MTALAFAALASLFLGASITPSAGYPMNSFRLGRDCVRALLLAILVIAPVVPPASAAGLRVVNRSFPGVYFGSFAANAGTFALYVREDNSGTFLGYLPGNGLGVSHSTVSIDDSGQFTFAAGQAANAPTISAGSPAMETYRER